MSCNMAFACALGFTEHCDVLRDLCIDYILCILCLFCLERLSGIGLYSTTLLKLIKFLNQVCTTLLLA